MATLRGAKNKLNRKFGVDIFGNKSSFEKKSKKNGGPGGNKFRKKLSDYGVSLMEKQKLRYAYGIMEKQFRKYYLEASSRRGITGEIMLQFLEQRLDNIVYRLGFGATRRAARQFVSHKHVTVNGKIVNIASFRCKPGDSIAICDKTSSKQVASRLLEQSQLRPVSDWLLLDKDTMAGTLSRIPTIEEIQPIVNIQLIVEFYSR